MTASIEHWKRKLLDLTKRNRLLNFRVTKVSTIRVVDELPREVFRRLYISEKPMRFKAKRLSVTPVSHQVEGDEQDDFLIDLEPSPSEAEEIVAYDFGEDTGRHTDEWLQTDMDLELLDRALRRVEQQARLSIEEQGVNTLFLALGMLRYSESAASAEFFKGPLVLLPVELKRRSARAGFELHVGDDEPIVNPALQEYLRHVGVPLPDVPDSDAMAEDYNVESYFDDVRALITDKAGWTVESEIYLGLFSFQKFVMFKDLEANSEAIGRHRVPQQLISRSSNVVVGLPDEIRSMELDAEFPPEGTLHVVDADSSQLRAIAACARGLDLVIEGPPGTGKSQTITNLIGQALADGKSILFVAEKMAALDVVHSRLVAVGLGEFCLELHSSRANKRAVMQDLAATLDASLQHVQVSSTAKERLPEVRTALAEYVAALHSPYGALELTPYAGYGELGAVRRSPAASLSGDISRVTREELRRTLRLLDDLVATVEPIGIPGQHPWRDSARTFYTEQDLEEVESQAQSAKVACAELIAAAAAVQENYGLPSIAKLSDVHVATTVGDILAKSPGAAVAVLENEAWNAPPPAALQLVEQGRDVTMKRETVRSWFTADVLEREHGEDRAFVSEKASGIFGFLAILNGRYRAIRSRWKSYRLPSYSKSIHEQADDLALVDQLLAGRAALRAAASEAEALFGPLWRGEQSDWAALEGYIEWVVTFRRTCVEHGIEKKVFSAATAPSPDVSAFNGLRQAADKYVKSLQSLERTISWPEGLHQLAPLTEVAARVKSLHENVHRGPQWAAFELSRREVSATLAGELLPSLFSGSIASSDLVPAFQRAFFVKWLSFVVRDRAPLARFSTLTHEQRVKEFRKLDENVLRENQNELVKKLRDAAQARLRGETERQALAHLQRQISRQRNIAPLRRTLRQADAAIRAIKPCFMMSPLTVAQLVDGSAPSFDLIIFDEASQLPAEDAIGAVIRGKQLVVVGDPKQLPPTNFFSVTTGQTAAEVDEDGNPLIDDAESILEEVMGAGVPMSRLKWHYRSAHESLIGFSNASFYDSDLYTFPSVEADTSSKGLQFVYVEDGRYEGKGLNAAEARHVADEVVKFAREQIRVRSEDGQPLSLGVGTFNIRQQLAIQDELEKRRREDPLLEDFFNRSGSEPFFVKNLENIQGDERDVIFLSVTYGPGTDGRIRYNFGPLNSQNGWRRLNVIVTRARQRMRVFSSMRAEDIRPTGPGSDGPRLLREFLTFAEHGRLDGVTIGALSDTESPFEREVAQELVRHGVEVVPQVGISGYRIDIGVLDSEVKGRFVCGIECDGVAYHSSETARDRDRLRQQVLEARGWTIHRVWSTDWFKDRRGQVDRLLQLIERDRAGAKARVQAEEAAVAEQRRHAEDQGGRQGDVRIRERQEVPRVVENLGPYIRPVAAEYVLAGGEGQYSRQDILAAPDTVMLQAIRYVVSVESPVHKEDVYARVASMWGTRVGSRVRNRLARSCEGAVRRGLMRARGEFLWNDSEDCIPRTRSLVKTPAERIAPEEYEAVITAILATGHSFPRAQLTTEVRAVLGFSRTGALLDEAIGSAIDTMLRRGIIGEGSAGVRLRKAESRAPS